MRRFLKVFALAGLLGGAVPAITQSAAQAVVGDVTTTLHYTGAEQSFAIPKGVLAVRVTAVGGHGAPRGNASGGRAAQVTAEFSVVGMSALYVDVGGNGVDGGFNGGVGGGGGASDVRSVPRCGTANCVASLNSRQVVAAGGGGAGSTGLGVATFDGGKGGDVEAPGIQGNGSDSPDFAAGGLGGAAATVDTPGDGGAGFTDTHDNIVSVAGNTGALGLGGTGGAISGSTPGGGGGGGYFGGGGGASGGVYDAVFHTGAGGGGGGSNFVVAGAPFQHFVVDESGTPSVTIAYDRVATSLVATPVLVKISPLGIFIGKVSATLKRGDNGAPIANESIVFSAAGKLLCSATTDGGGTATCNGLNLTVAALLNLGYDAKYNGAGAYLPSASSAAILAL